MSWNVPGGVHKLRVSSCALTFPFVATVWSDDEWLKKFSGKTLEENKEEGGAEAPKAEAQEVRKTTFLYPRYSKG